MKIAKHRLADVPFVGSSFTRGKMVPQFIVMHYTAGASAASSIKAIADRGLSAHLFIDRDGAITQTVPFDTVAFHAGVSEWRGHVGLNKNAIGIEMANLGLFDVKTSTGWTRQGLGRVFKDDEVLVAPHRRGGPVRAWELFPEVQVTAALEVASLLRGAYETVQEIVGHDDISWPRKSDPGPAFPMERFKNLAGGAQNTAELRADDLGRFEVVVRDGDDLRLRGGPGTSFAIKQSLKPGTSLRVRRVDGDWAEVDLQGDGIPDGFVHKSFIRRTGD